MEILLYYINISISVIGTSYFPFYLSRKMQLGLFNPLLITFLFSIAVSISQLVLGPLIILDKGLLDPYYNYSILMFNIDLLCSYIVANVALKFAKRRLVYINNLLMCYGPKWSIRRRKMIFGALFFLSIACLSFVLLAQHSFSILEWIKNPREGYQLHREGAGSFYAFSLLFLSVSFSILLLYIKKVKNLFITFFIFVAFVWLLGSKGNILNFAIYTFVILWYRKYEHTKILMILLIPAVFFVLLVNLSRSSVVEVLEYFDYYTNSALYYEAYFNDEIDLYYGEIMLTKFWGLVPRALYEDKPYVYGFLLINEFFYPGAAEASNTPAFGGPIVAFADFGLLGVITYSLLNFKLFFKVVGYYLVLKKYSFDEIKTNPFMIYVFLLLFAPSFLYFFLFPWSLVMYLLLIKTISFFNRAVIRT